MTVAYKFLKEGLRSDFDDSPWTLGEWREVPAPTEACVGLNASLLIPDALKYVRGAVVARVEGEGTVIDSGDKLTFERMRIVEYWPWTKEHSVRFAIFAATQLLEIYEGKHPNDLRPRQAIEAAQAVLDGKAVDAAVLAAIYATRAATRAAADAAYAVYAAANAAKKAELKQRIHDYALSLVEIKEITQ